MKVKRVAVAAATVTGASAQLVQYGGTTSSTPAPIAYQPTPSSSASYVTVTYDDCPSQSIETLITITEGTTVTYCPKCSDQPTLPITSKGPAHTTVYTTVYQSLCSTGLTPVTYTVTEECDEPTPTWASKKEDHVPQGFTVTVKDCHVCDKTPVPVTITEPCHDGCGKPKPTPAPTGGVVGQIPDGQVQAPGPSGGAGGSGSNSPGSGSGGSPLFGGNGSGSNPPAPGSNGSGSNSPAPSGGSGSGSNPAAQGGNGSGANRPPASPLGENCPGPQCKGSSKGGSPAPGGSPSNGGAPPYPTGDKNCPGPQCQAQGTAGAPSPASSGNTSNIEPYTPGSAGTAIASFGFVSSICMAFVVAALAFAL